MKNKRKKFVVTTSGETREKLIKAGFKLIYETPNKSVFANNRVRLNFEELEKVHETDTLTF